VNALILSEATPRIAWADTVQFSQHYGVKAATSLAIPRAWTPPFLLLSVKEARELVNGIIPADLTGAEGAERFSTLAGVGSQLIVRSSVVGESIWDRGTYQSVRIPIENDFEITSKRLLEAAKGVIASTEGRESGLMIQRYVRPASQGEFGNLQRISKTRDQWEIGTREGADLTARLRLNSQRDSAADPAQPLAVRSGLARERLFGAIGAWLNNELLIGRSQRLNCEWVTDNRQFYIVQLDEEDDDFAGVNPFQVRVPPAIRPAAENGDFLKLADAATLAQWDKLQVLEQLWEEDAVHKPTLFYLPLSDLPTRATSKDHARLKTDFAELIGPRGIVVRTSVRAGEEKLPNLARTECLKPDAAASWCFNTARSLRKANPGKELAFVAHRFVASRASVWARAEPDKPMVEINALWGLPDALQYCPYDIWEVHVPTGVATDYPEYKSDMLISRDDGSWEYVRVKNDLARNNCIGSMEAKDIALRSVQIAERLGRPCHIMWFVGCVEEDGASFNLPWYWTEAHDAERNPDRTAYRTFTVRDNETLSQFIAFEGSRTRQAVALRPADLGLMRNVPFIEAVGHAASNAQVPVILSGSTLAHAYYQLRKQGCTVVTPSEKEHARVRRTANLGKLVRDKIPGKIAQRQEMRTTRRIEGELRKGFLISKLFEEALEVRNATSPAQKAEELADLFEVFRAIAKLEGKSVSEITKVANQKRRKAGGFEEGLILLQTAIGSSDRWAIDADRGVGDVLGGPTADDTAEFPFSFFGFMEIDQPHSMLFEPFGVRLELVLRPDRIEIRLSHSSEQLSLPL